MFELLEASFSLVNLPYTILLIVMFLYWGLYLLGAFGSEALDLFGLDFDADVDIDTDIDADVDVDLDTDLDAGGAHGGVMPALFQFFYLGEVPLMIIFSVLILSMWTISVLANYFLRNGSALVALALFLPIVVVGLIVTRTIIMPFAPLLKQIFDQSGDKVEIVGKTCVVTSSEATPQYGQAEFAMKGAPVLLNVITREGVTLKKGQEAVIYDYDQTNNTYLIAALDVNTSPEKEE